MSLRPALWFFLFLCVCAGISRCDRVHATTLEYTIPRFNALVMYPGTDSAGAVCEDSGDTLRDLRWTALYGYPITGGGWRLIRLKDVSGRVGEPDTLDVDDGWSYYVAARDSLSHEGCHSNIVSLPGTATGVPTVPAGPPIVRREVYDVQGRLVKTRAASGIYFVRTFYADGATRTTKVVIVK